MVGLTSQNPHVARTSYLPAHEPIPRQTMKKSIILSALLTVASLTTASAAVAIVSQFPLSSDLSNNVTGTSAQTLANKTGGTNPTVTYADGSATITTNYTNVTSTTVSGLEASANYQGGSWAVSFDIKFKNTSAALEKIFASNFATANGIIITASNTTDGAKFGLLGGATGVSNYNKATTLTTNLNQDATAFQHLTLINYGGSLYLYSDYTKGTFGTSGVDHLTQSSFSGQTGLLLNQFHVGFGYNSDSYGVVTSTPLTMKNLTTYKFDAATDTLESVLIATGAAPAPEPTTASLSLLGLAALMMRRRRA